MMGLLTLCRCLNFPEFTHFRCLAFASRLLGSMVIFINQEAKVNLQFPPRWFWDVDGVGGELPLVAWLNMRLFDMSIVSVKFLQFSAASFDHELAIFKIAVFLAFKYSCMPLFRWLCVLLLLLTM